MSKRLVSFTSRGKILDGKLVLDNERYFKGNISLFENTPKVRIIIERERGTRSANQNKYYWGSILPTISESLGHTSEELHEIFRSKYLRTKRVWRGGDITVLRSTPQLTTDEFSEYLQSIIIEAGELGITVQPADKNWNLVESLRSD